MTAHPSHLMLDRLTADDLSETARAQAQAHVEGCTDCHAYVASLAEHRQAHLHRRPVAQVMAELQTRDDRTWWKTIASWFVAIGKPQMIIATGGLALAAMCAVLVMPHASISEDDSRFKGAGMTLHLKRGEQVRVLVPKEKIRAEDALRVVLTLQKPQTVSVWFVDVAGQIDRMTPRPVVLAAGENPLPGSVQIERPCRDVWLVLGEGDSVSIDGERRLRDRVASGKARDDERWLPEGMTGRLLVCE